MKIRLAGVILTTIWALHAAAVQAQARRDIDITKLSVVYKAEGVERAVVRPDLTYRSGNAELKFDLYAPPVVDGLRPAILFVSGAGDVKHWQIYKDYGRLAAAHGFVGLVPDKRYPPALAGVRTAVGDTRALLDHVRANAAALGVDPKRICIWAFSNGGRTTALPFQTDAPDIRCLIAYYGIMSVRSYLPADAGADLLAQYAPEVAVAAPAARKLPIFIARVGKDAESINRSIDNFVAAALTANQPLTVVNYPDGEHGFEVLNDTAESRRVIAQTFEFIREATQD